MSGSVIIRPTPDYEKLKNELLHSGSVFSDNQFPPNSRSIYPDGRAPPGDRFHGNIIWKRPSEMFRDPTFIVNKARRHDLDQGLLGNCWFISAAAVLATAHRKNFEIVLPKDQGFEEGQYTGMFRFNFWWYGKWTEVIVDDYLPTDGRHLIYCSNKARPNELWPCLLEKAYAKLRGCYEHLDGGKMQDAMVDLTGGISEVIDIRDKKEVSPELYSLLYKSHRMKTMMGACIFRPDNAASREVKMSNGLYMGHAYSITGFRQIPTGQGTINLIRLRNPWGQSEWIGPWSDNSAEMAHLSRELQEDMKFRSKDDGEFWMSYSDFLSNFQEIQLCHLQPDAFITELADNERKQDWMVTVYHDSWIRGVTAGGCGNKPNERLYWKNPQFFVSLHNPDSMLGHGDDCTLIVSLMEKEKNNQSKIAVGFDVYKLKDPDFKPLDDARAPRNALLLTRRSGSYVFYREITKRFELPPGNYVIIPCTFYPHEEAEFLLRLFTEKHADSGVLDEDVTSQPPSPAFSISDPIVEAFERHAGHDGKMDALELSAFLEDVSSMELDEKMKFPLESCRSLMVLMDQNKSGFLNLSEAKRAWKEIKAYRQIFKQFDADHSNTVDTYELGTMFARLGFPVSRGVLAAIVRRYGGRDSRLTLPDFVMIICKLTTLFASFHQQQKQSGRGEDMAEFSRNEFLQTTMSM